MRGCPHAEGSWAARDQAAPTVCTDSAVHPEDRKRWLLYEALYPYLFLSPNVMDFPLNLALSLV